MQSNDVSGAFQTYRKAVNDELLARIQLERAQLLYDKGAIAKSALDNYEPAAPLSLGALAAAGIAAFWGWAATHLIAWPFRRRSRLRAMR